MDDDARSGKRDRLARLTRVVSLLRAHPDGMAIKDIAKRIDVSVRTVYRDLNAIEGEIGIGVWSDGGRWGLAADEFLPPLKLTQDEAMAVVLSARLMVRYADKYDPDLASAFEKLGEVLPPALGEHVARTLDVLSRHPRDERFSRHVNLLTKAWAERRIVSLDYEPARYGPDSAPRTARVRPYLIEPSLQTHALYLIGFDETREAIRTFKVERIRDLSRSPETLRPAGARPRRGDVRSGLGHHRGPGAGRGRPPLLADGRRPRPGGPLAPVATCHRGGGRFAHLAGDRRGDDRGPALGAAVG